MPNRDSLQRTTGHEGDVVFCFIADVSKIPNGKNYLGNAACIQINRYKKYLWNKIKTAL